MVVLAMAIVRPAAAPVTIEGLRGHVGRRLRTLPALRSRLRRVPLGLHHPILVEDPGFEVANHVRAETLPAPGDERTLDELFARAATEVLDRSRPLWRLTLVDGLADGRQALVFQFHHCLMDGVALLGSLAGLLDPAAEASPADAGSQAEGPKAKGRERGPGGVRLLAGAVGHHAADVVRLPGLVLRTAKGVLKLRAQRAASAVAVPATKESPVCSINTGTGAERRFARAALPLADVLLVKQAAAVSVNDVALALCGGALRALLLERGDLPARPLLAAMPMGIDAPGAPSRLTGNRVATLTTTLATDVADPWERLARIAAVSAESRSEMRALGTEVPGEWAEMLPPFLLEFGARRAFARLEKQPERIGWNVIVSNLRGPTVPWAVDGASVEELYISGPLGHRVGALFVLTDQGNRLVFSILTVAGSVDDPGVLAAGLHAALAELVGIARARSVGVDPAV